VNRRDTWILYTRELRSALRERTIVVNSILMPIFLYPVLLWVMFSAQVFVQGLNEGFTSRVVFTTPVPLPHTTFLDTLRARESVVVVGRGGEGVAEAQGPSARLEGNAPATLEVIPESEALARLAAGEVDAVVAFLPPETEGRALDDNFRLQVRYDGAETRSARARSRVEAAAAAYRDGWIVREAEARGLGESERSQFVLSLRDVSTADDIGAVLLGQMISFFMVIMVALGCFIPAVDTTAGERERSTWETLMTVSASRASVVASKYLYVATLGIAAAVLNVVALFLSMGAVVRPLMETAGEEITFNIPLVAIPVMMAGAGALALFFAAAMMILAAFARSFKDGQAMVQPVYWLVLLPLFLGQQTDRNLNPVIASVPVANVSMMIRDAIGGVFLWPYIAQTLLVTLATVLLCLAAARWVLRFEDFLIGSFDGSLWRFLRDHRRRTPGGAP